MPIHSPAVSVFSPAPAGLEAVQAAIIEAGKFLDAKGWAPATAGNYSMRLPGGDIAVTVSGKHKGALTAEDIMLLTADGAPKDNRTPSAEAPLHVQIYALKPEIGAVLHTHSVNSVVLGRVLEGRSALALEGYELQKAFPGIHTHEGTVILPIVDNSQDMPALAAEVERQLAAAPAAPGYIIRGHGVYAWGKDMAEARRVIEAMEFLFACVLEEMRIRG